jgi:ABC-type Fe3+-hydroxamate transport system substrate-binding protein
MPLFSDQLNRIVELPAPPRRIISLVPSQTELLYELGLEEAVVGITKFCVHPQKWFGDKVRVGGTKTVHTDRIVSLQPDLIIANKEENVKEQIEELAASYPVWISDVNTLEEAFTMIEEVGMITGKQREALALANHIRHEFSNLSLPELERRTAYLIWNEPYMTVGGDTFIHHMLLAAGLQNIFGNSSRYPSLTLAELQSANPELLLLSSEPYPFRQKHIDELQVYLPRTKILLVDGEMFSWYGSRLQKAPAYFKSLQAQIAALP